MPKFALVRGGAVVRIREMESADHLAHKVDAVKDGGDGGPFVRPVADPGKPEINPLIETLETSQKITPKAVEIVYTIKPWNLNTVKVRHVAEVKAAYRGLIVDAFPDDAAMRALATERDGKVKAVQDAGDAVALSGAIKASTR